MNKTIITTDHAPEAIGPYSQAVEANGLVFISGQIPLVPETMSLINDDFAEQAEQVFANLSAIAKAANNSLDNTLKLTVYLTDLENFSLLNDVMAKVFSEPFPARAAVQVSALPRNALLEVDAILASA